jgi:hypothetical protein
MDAADDHSTRGQDTTNKNGEAHPCPRFCRCPKLGATCLIIASFVNRATGANSGAYANRVEPDL